MIKTVSYNRNYMTIDLFQIDHNVTHTHKVKKHAFEHETFILFDCK